MVWKKFVFIGFIGICRGGCKIRILNSQNGTGFRFQNRKSGFQIPNQTYPINPRRIMTEVSSACV